MSKATPPTSPLDSFCMPKDPFGPLEVFPANGARDVTQNAPIRVLYSEGFWREFKGELKSLIEVFSQSEFGGLVVVDGETLRQGDELVFSPKDKLEVGNYKVNIYDLENELVFPLEFSVVAKDDLEVPQKTTILSMDSQDSVRNCDGVEEVGYRVDIEMSSSTDDGPDGSLEYLIYLLDSGGKGKLVARQRYYTSDRVVSSFFLPLEEGQEAICINAFVVDGLQKISDASNTKCFDPRTGVHFDGACSLAKHNENGFSFFLILSAILGFLLLRKKSFSI